MAHATSGPSYVTIWAILVALVVAGLALFVLPLSHGQITVLLFAIAIVKATLVLREFMHLKGVPGMFYAIAFVPLVLALVMTVLLVPDIALR